MRFNIDDHKKKGPEYYNEVLKRLQAWDHIGMISANALKGAEIFLKEAGINPEHCEVEYHKQDSGYELVIKYKRANEG